MTRAHALAGGVAVTFFTASLALLFPTEPIVRRLVARAAPPDWPVVFRGAVLRPRGLWLTDVTFRRPDGSTVVHAESVHWSPSLIGLLRDGRGLPWHVTADVCGGTGEATVAADGPGVAVALTWHDTDLSACPPLAVAGGALAGRARGAARLVLAPRRPPAGSGRVDLERATWRGEGPLAAIGSLHAAAASVGWRLADGHLLVEALDLHGPEVSASGSGELRLTEPFEESDLTLRLALAPQADAPPLLRLLLATPTGVGSRLVMVGGTLAHPQVQFQ
ncbi:MAG TPA: type II secretion system protein GspN [Candidatus Nitrosopolaris sp.]|nr:type II secretion system protein GspN [Candidatus Nitrosopolaris sp.]